MNKSKRSKKNKRGGGGCSTGFRFDYSDNVTNGTPSLVKYDTCQNGGKRSKGKKRRVLKSKKKIDKKKVDLIINKLCASLKKKCTPKYKRILKKIVVNNL
jgi:hypothetical protein